MEQAQHTFPHPNSTGAELTPPFRVEQITLLSKNGPLKGILTVNPAAPSERGIVLLPGLSVGLRGEFISSFEQKALRSGACKYSLRFNPFGLSQDQLNDDIRGFTLSRAADDLRAAVLKLREAGASDVWAVCSSAGTQSALIVAAAGEGPQRPDRIIARSAVVDCFHSLLGSLPKEVIQRWKDASSFQFPVGGRPVTLGAEFLRDIERLSPSDILANLRVPTVLLHGALDKTTPLSVTRSMVEKAVPGTVQLVVEPGAGHELPRVNSQPVEELLIDHLLKG